MSESHIWAVGLKHIMPTVIQVENVMDSWEVLASEDQGTAVHSPSGQNVSRSGSYSRLTKLEYLSWPQMPNKTAQLLAHKFPKVVVNPKPGLCPEQANPAIAVDEPLILSVAPFWEQEQLLVGQCDHSVHGLCWLCCTSTHSCLILNAKLTTSVATHG